TARRYGFQGLLNLHSLALRFQGFAAFEITEQTGDSLANWISQAQLKSSTFSQVEFMTRHIFLRSNMLE
ncbi:hypothetical protein ACW73I_13435, partial [Methylomonas sp. MgM2]